MLVAQPIVLCTQHWAIVSCDIFVFEIGFSVTAVCEMHNPEFDPWSSSSTELLNKGCLLAESL